MKKRFEEVFEEVREELGCEWFELYESADFNKVAEKLAEEFGTEVFDSDEYLEWDVEMAEEL